MEACKFIIKLMILHQYVSDSLTDSSHEKLWKTRTRTFCIKTLFWLGYFLPVHFKWSSQGRRVEESCLPSSSLQRRSGGMQLLTVSNGDGVRLFYYWSRTWYWRWPPNVRSHLSTHLQSVRLKLFYDLEIWLTFFPRCSIVRGDTKKHNKKTLKYYQIEDLLKFFCYVSVR